MEIDNLTVDQGSTDDNGGAIDCERCKGITIKNSTFKNITVGEKGGALFFQEQVRDPDDRIKL